MTIQTIVPGELHNFIKEYADDYDALRLIFFFAAYPNAGFSTKAIFGALGLKDNQQKLKQALARLVEAGISTISTNGPVPVYRLGDDASTRRQVMELGKLSFSEKRELLRQTRSSAV